MVDRKNYLKRLRNKYTSKSLRRVKELGLLETCRRAWNIVTKKL